ncbi:MAG: LysR substrate-binding domain-containing protein [Leptothrix ochracea]|uniref:LysR substrate-binding domain-containing protein n=3 Tax=Leptothrix ochracea TaxID=735331 RepID=UPI0034E2B3A6
MTLTELRYIVAVARERHFGRAAEACFVSQPTLSVAVRKLEDELALKLFERGGNEVSVTPLGAVIVRQAQVTLDNAAMIKELARRGKDPLSGALRLGIIYTIGPYLLPELVRQAIARVPQMPLLLHENFTVKLLEMLRTGEIDCAILAEPFADANLSMMPLYDEPFVIAVPGAHPLAKRPSLSATELKQETMLLLGAGHCFRDHVLEVCPEFARFSTPALPSTEGGMQRSFEGSSLETIKHMVASGMGITVLPLLSVPPASQQPLDTQGHPLVRYIPFTEPAPTRRVVLAWRRSFTRSEAITALHQAIQACALGGVSWPEPSLPSPHVA